MTQLNPNLKTIVIPYIHQMTAQIDPAIPMVNTLFNKLYELYWAIAQMGLGLGGIAYDLSPLDAVRFALEGNGQLST
jgi:hypothetical protein